MIQPLLVSSFEVATSSTDPLLPPGVVEIRLRPTILIWLTFGLGHLYCLHYAHALVKPVKRHLHTTRVKFIAGPGATSRSLSATLARWQRPARKDLPTTSSKKRSGSWLNAA